jgi:hypothetical protein
MRTLTLLVLHPPHPPFDFPFDLRVRTVSWLLSWFTKPALDEVGILSQNQRVLIGNADLRLRGVTSVRFQAGLWLGSSGWSIRRGNSRPALVLYNGILVDNS